MDENPPKRRKRAMKTSIISKKTIHNNSNTFPKNETSQLQSVPRSNNFATFVQFSESMSCQNNSPFNFKIPEPKIRYQNCFQSQTGITNDTETLSAEEYFKRIPQNLAFLNPSAIEVKLKNKLLNADGDSTPLEDSRGYYFSGGGDSQVGLGNDVKRGECCGQRDKDSSVTESDVLELYRNYGANASESNRDSFTASLDRFNFENDCVSDGQDREQGKNLQAD